MGGVVSGAFEGEEGEGGGVAGGAEGAEVGCA